jgi:hypothetical protein
MIHIPQAELELLSIENDVYSMEILLPEYWIQWHQGHSFVDKGPPA